MLQAAAPAKTPDARHDVRASLAIFGCSVLGGSWVVRSRVISKVTIIITHIRGLITTLITTHEPPSSGGLGLWPMALGFMFSGFEVRVQVPHDFGCKNLTKGEISSCSPADLGFRV